MLEEVKNFAVGQVVGFALLFACIILLGHNDRPDNFGSARPARTSEASEDDRESGMDIGDQPSPSDKEVEFCRNNKRKFDEDFTTGGGEQGAYCRLLLKELPCDHDDCPDDPYAMYEDIWDSEERPDTTNGI